MRRALSRSSATARWINSRGVGTVCAQEGKQRSAMKNALRQQPLKSRPRTDNGLGAFRSGGEGPDVHPALLLQKRNVVFRLGRQGVIRIDSEGGSPPPRKTLVHRL